MRENGGFDNFNMIEISSEFCCDHRDAERKEQEYITQLQADMNTRKSFIAESKIEYKKQYRSDNSDKIKQYYIDNSESIKAKNNQYRIMNREKIRERQNAKNAERKNTNLSLDLI